MKSFSKNIILACFSLAIAQTSCPPEPQGILQTRKPAIVELTIFGSHIVYTEQIKHAFEKDETMEMLYESPGKDLPAIHHHGCRVCKTYSVMNKCGYTLASADDIAEFEAQKEAAAAEAKTEEA